MTEFKKGDRVKRVYHLIKCINSYYNGNEFTIKGFNDIGNVLDPDNGPHDPRYLTVVSDPIEEAKAVLAAAGYTVEPPKPELTGQVAVYKMDEHVYATTKESWDNWARVGTTGRCVLIAIIDWTEGEGI